MTTDRRAFLRTVMLTAWDFARAEPGRPFGDCLRGAWKIIRGLARAGRALVKSAKSSPTGLTQSPIARSLRGRRHGRWHAYKAAYLTARLGW